MATKSTTAHATPTLRIALAKARASSRASTAEDALAATAKLQEKIDVEENETETLKPFQAKKQVVLLQMSVQRLLKKLKKEVESRDRDEVRRVIREYSEKNHLKLFKANIDTVLGALIGADRTQTELTIHGIRRVDSIYFHQPHAIEAKERKIFESES